MLVGAAYGVWHEAYGFGGCVCSCWPMAAVWNATLLAGAKSSQRPSGGRRGPRCVWWVPRPFAGPPAGRHASSSVGRLACSGRQISNRIKMGVAVSLAVAVAEAMAIRRPG